MCISFSYLIFLETSTYSPFFIIRNFPVSTKTTPNITYIIHFFYMTLNRFGTYSIWHHNSKLIPIWTKCWSFTLTNQCTFASDGQTVISLVDVDSAEYRRKIDTKTVRRNVTLPSWLNYEAEHAGINVSRLLQEALKTALGVNKTLWLYGIIRCLTTYLHLTKSGNCSKFSGKAFWVQASLYPSSPS